jgi:hypothetical protein
MDAGTMYAHLADVEYTLDRSHHVLVDGKRVENQPGKPLVYQSTALLTAKRYPNWRVEGAPVSAASASRCARSTRRGPSRTSPPSVSRLPIEAGATVAQQEQIADALPTCPHPDCVDVLGHERPRRLLRADGRRHRGRSGERRLRTRAAAHRAACRWEASMTRAERDELAKMLEEIAASLDAAPDRAKANAAVEAEKLRAQFPSLYAGATS